MSKSNVKSSSSKVNNFITKKTKIHSNKILNFSANLSSYVQYLNNVTSECRHQQNIYFIFWLQAADVSKVIFNGTLSILSENSYLVLAFEIGDGIIGLNPH